MVTSGSTYFLSNKKAATVCDLSGEDQKSIIGFPKQGSDNQKAGFPSFRSKGDPNLSSQWKVQNTGNGWTFQNALDGKYLDIEGKVENGSKVVAVQTDSPRVWDIRPDQNDNDACRQVHNGILSDYLTLTDPLLQHFPPRHCFEPRSFQTRRQRFCHSRANLEPMGAWRKSSLAFRASLRN